MFLTFHYSIGLLREKLTVKTGGNQKQLTRQFQNFEYYRLEMLYKFIIKNWYRISKNEQRVIKSEFERKGIIYLTGAIKRKNFDECYKILNKWHDIVSIF